MARHLALAGAIVKPDQPDLFGPVPPAPPRFEGPSEAPRDDERSDRLQAQMESIRGLMIDGRWRTLGAIENALGHPQSSISAQLRHLRKERFGSYRVEKRHLGGGLWEYRLLPPLEDEA